MTLIKIDIKSINNLSSILTLLRWSSHELLVKNHFAPSSKHHVSITEFIPLKLHTAGFSEMHTKLKEIIFGQTVLFRSLSKFWKAAVSFMSVCLPPVRPAILLHGTRLPLEGFTWNMVFQYFLNLSRKFKLY
jgi:hypothetical protein